MRKIPARNYLILALILVLTVLVVINIAIMYKLDNRIETDFYNYANTITGKEYDSYIVENPDSIVYIYDKYDSTYKDFEEELKNGLESYDLKTIFIYIDKRNLNKKFLTKLKELYDLDLEYNKKPIILLIEDSELKNMIEIGEDTKVEDLRLGEFR